MQRPRVITGEPQQPGPGDAKRGVCSKSVLGELVDPAENRPRRLRPGERQPVRGDEPGRLAVLPRRQSLVAGVVDEALARQPVEGAAPELRHTLGRAEHQLAVEKLPEDRVIAVPLAAFVERNEEKVFLLELGKKLGRPLAVQHGVAEVAGHAFEDRRIEEKGAPIGVQLVQHDLREVVDDEPIRAAEASPGSPHDRRGREATGPRVQRWPASPRFGREAARGLRA